MLTRVLLRAALVAACLAGAAIAVVAYVSEVRLQSARPALQKRDVRRALPILRGSESPLNPSGFRDVGLASALLATGRGAEAERMLAAAVRREPENVRLWAAQGLIQLARGRVAAARVSFTRVRRLDPHLSSPF